MTQKMRRKKPMAFLTGLLAFAMSASYFYAPNSSNKLVIVEAAGEVKTFDATSTGATGADVDNSTGALGGNIVMSGGIYYWTVPFTGNYEIQALGANRSDGARKGANMKGEFTLTQGSVLKILVGQKGASTSAGSGGTFVTTNTNSPLIVAGGAGYSGAASTGTAGQNVYIGYSTYNGYSSGGCGGAYYTYGGSGGNGGSSTNSGAGLTGNGASGAKSFTNGGAGHGSGGFGGGGNASYGGGGGYSGGAGYTSYSVCTEHYDGTGYVFDGNVIRTNGGGGGGSYNSGTNAVNATRTDNVNNDGQVTIKFLSPTVTMSPVNGTEFQNNFIDVNWTGNVHSDATITKYEIQAGTTPGGTNIVPLTDKGMSTSQRISVSAGMPGNTTIYWRVRATDSKGRVGPWIEQTVIYSNNVPTITATTNVPANLDVSLEKRAHQFSINSLKDPDDFNYVTLFADVLDKNGTLVPGSKKQIVLDSSLVSSAQLISGTSTEKDGSLQGPLNHTTPFNLKLALQPNFTNGTFDLTLTKADGVTNVIKSGQKLITGRTMQPTSASTPENFTLRIYPEDRQNSNTLAASPLAGVNDVTEITIPFTSDTRNYLPALTNVKHDVAKRVFSDAEGFNRISVTGHVDDSDPADTVSMYYEVQAKAENYNIQVTTVGGKVVPRYGTKTQTFSPMVDDDFAFTYQIDPNLESGNYALLVYGYDSQEGIGDYYEIPFTVSREGPTIDFVADYTTAGGQTIRMSSSQKQLISEDSKAKLYFTPNNYATFEYAGYLIRGGVVKDLRIRGAFTNEVKSTFIGVDFGQDPITLMNGEQTDFKLGDIIVFKFKATSATGIVTEKDVRILIGDDSSTFAPINDANLPSIP